MAFTADGFALSVTLLDTAGKSFVMDFKLRAADHATAVTDTATVIAALAGVTDLEIGAYAIRTLYVEDTPVLPTAVTGWDKASITVDLATPNKKANLTIPGPDVGIFTASSGAGYNIVDASDAALGSYIDLFKAAGECYISDGEDVATSPNPNGKRVSVKVTKSGQR